MKAYYYLFYKLYKFWELISFPKFWSDFKANISICALEIWLILSLINYYNIFIDRSYSLDKTIFFLIVGVIMVINILTFVYLDKWKDYNKEFDKLPRKKNIKGGIIVWFIILLIIANLIYSFYLMSQIDWSQYK